MRKRKCAQTRQLLLVVAFVVVVAVTCIGRYSVERIPLLHADLTVWQHPYSLAVPRTL